MKVCNILGVNINVTSMNKKVLYIQEMLESLKGNYICILNIHTTIMSYYDKKYREIQNSGVMTLLDGAPLSIVSRIMGFKDEERVTGPDLMEEIFRISESKGYKYYFYGSTEDILLELRKSLMNKYPRINIVGRYSSIFRQLTADEDNQIINKIKREPKIIQKLSLEWLYRLIQDQKRLWKRYLMINTKFILKLILSRKSRCNYEK